ncbi:MAG: pantoate--beta-alanine ligase [Bacteroidales bacterium]
MKIFTGIAEIQDYLSNCKDKSIGFVPTMGALHEGHLALVRKARQENDIVVCSIFVNPIQFNNPDDLKKYPRTFEEDCEMLDSVSCDVVFYPDEKEMYPESVSEVYDFGELDKVMEGEFRPGHFNGVAIVVRKLFEIVNPCKAYFGLKDYHQLQVVKAMVRMVNSPVEIISCETVRESDGLAMSSRNRRLTDEIRGMAPVIYRTLSQVSEWEKSLSVEQVIQKAIEQIESYKPLKVEYFEIADSVTLQKAGSWDSFPSLVACTAVWAGEVRLIDNILIL